VNSRWHYCFCEQIAELIFDLIVTHDHNPSFLTLEGMTYVKLCQAYVAVRGKIQESLIIVKEEVILDFLGG
jgi:hypothetical protein